MFVIILLFLVADENPPLLMLERNRPKRGEWLKWRLFSRFSWSFFRFIQCYICLTGILLIILLNIANDRRFDLSNLKSFKSVKRFLMDHVHRKLDIFDIPIVVVLDRVLAIVTSIWVHWLNMGKLIDCEWQILSLIFFIDWNNLLFLVNPCLLEDLEV